MRSFVPDRVQNVIRGQAGWFQFVVLLCLSDLCFYLVHRLVHTVPWLWRFHAVHHSSEQMDWLATFRVHPVDQVLNSTIIAVPAVALGFSPAPLLAYALVYRVHSLLLHSNVHVDFGPLGRVFASPRYHHWHHADEPQAYDRNFGGQLVIWDRLFDTLYESDELPAGTDWEARTERLRPAAVDALAPKAPSPHTQTELFTPPFFAAHCGPNLAVPVERISRCERLSERSVGRRWTSRRARCRMPARWLGSS